MGQKTEQATSAVETAVKVGTAVSTIGGAVLTVIKLLSKK